jgi:hypothetical protein
VEIVAGNELYVESIEVEWSYLVLPEKLECSRA